MKLRLTHYICIALKSFQMLSTHLSQGKLPMSQRAHQGNEGGGRGAGVSSTESQGIGKLTWDSALQAQ